MAGKKQAPLSRVYVVLIPALYDMQSPMLQGVYVSEHAALEACNNQPGYVHAVDVNYHGADDAANGNADEEAAVKTPKAKTKATKTDKESNGDSATKTTSKKKIVPEGDAGSLTGQTLASTGTLRTLDRSTFEQTVLKFGGTFTSKIAEASSIVLGEKPGDKKLEEINGKGYSTITEDEFYDLIGADFAPPAKRAKKE